MAKLNLEFMGGLTKFVSKNREVRQIQVKMFGNDNDSEVTSMVREIEDWAKEHIVTQLTNLSEVVPALDIPWKSIALPMTDYGMCFDVDFGQDIYTGKSGVLFKAKLTEISFKINKEGMREGLLTFLKNGDENDDGFQRMFLNATTTDENGKKKPLPVKIVLNQCETFLIGIEPPKDEDEPDVPAVDFDSDDDEEQTTEVYGSEG